MLWINVGMAMTPWINEDLISIKNFTKAYVMSSIPKTLEYAVLRSPLIFGWEFLVEWKASEVSP